MGRAAARAFDLWCRGVTVRTGLRGAIGNISDTIHKVRWTNVNCQRDRAFRLHFRAGGIDTVPCNVTVCRCDTPGYAAERVVAMRAPPAREPMQIERKRKPASRNAIVKSMRRQIRA
jgi:hypothetical protein